MVHFCEEVVQMIKLAHDRDEVESIINNSIVLFRKSKSQDVGRFIINMIVMLRITGVQAITAQEHSNAKHALEIFRKLQQLDTDLV